MNSQDGNHTKPTKKDVLLPLTCTARSLVAVLLSGEHLFPSVRVPVEKGGLDTVVPKTLRGKGNYNTVSWILPTCQIRLRLIPHQRLFGLRTTLIQSIGMIVGIVLEN